MELTHLLDLIKCKNDLEPELSFSLNITHAEFVSLFYKQIVINNIHRRLIPVSVF